MATSTINGNVGAANSGAIVTAILLDGRVNSGNFGANVGAPVPPVPFTSAVASATGAFTLSGLLAGTYLIEAYINGPAAGGSTIGVPIGVGTSQNRIAVDGSSTYAI